MPHHALPAPRVVVQLASLLIAAAVLVVGPSFNADAAQKCIKIGQKSVCFNDGKGQKNNGGEQNGGGAGDHGGGGGGDQGGGGGGNDGGGGDQGGGGQGGGNDDTPQPQSKPLDCAKAQCDAGEVKLDKPSKYGACCAPAEGLCPADRPVGTPPNCCAHGTVFREGGCYPETCGPGMVGTPPHCDRMCAPGKVKVDQTCYDPCPAGTLGTPPNCRCPSGQVWDKNENACKGCPTGMVGTPPNCQCPSNTILKDGTCQGCPNGQVAVNGNCQCPKGKGMYQGECRKCWGGRESVNGVCKCPPGRKAYPNNDSDCVKGIQERCVWRGEAPICGDPECLPGEVFRGSAYGKDSGVYHSLGGDFGKDCATGSKAFCCHFE